MGETMSKIWGGAFSKKTSEKLNKFMSAENLEVDAKLIPYEIKGSKAHVKMLMEQGIIKQEEGEEILKALGEIEQEWKEGKFKLKEELEDVHMNVESAVSERTPHGKKIHTARSRNDQVNLVMRMYMKNGIIDIKELVKKLQNSFLVQSKKKIASINKTSKTTQDKPGPIIIPGYTHTRVAQPLKLAMWAEGYIESLNKDLERLEQVYARIDKNPLGACALTGTSWNIDPKKTAKELGFKEVEKNPFNTISSRGELEAELLFVISLVSMKLSRISEEIIWLSYVGIVELPEEYCTGSSIMPNKKNPDGLELIRGKSGRIYGNLVNVLTILKGLMSGHNADTQETKKPVMDSVEQITACLEIMSEIIEKIEWNESKIKEELEKGNAYATEKANELVKKGMSFREAHEQVGKSLKK